mmetsp:Transcript_91174/g.294711  ORF Transcript_91174/g.294711 Transcript_91174/m.294711 type:complete len:256 (+) Transcript_91174:499-1266(+)
MVAAEEVLDPCATGEHHSTKSLLFALLALALHEAEELLQILLTGLLVDPVEADLTIVELTIPFVHIVLEGDQEDATCREAISSQQKTAVCAEAPADEHGTRPCGCHGRHAAAVLQNQLGHLQYARAFKNFCSRAAEVRRKRHATAGDQGRERHVASKSKTDGAVFLDACASARVHQHLALGDASDDRSTRAGQLEGLDDRSGIIHACAANDHNGRPLIADRVAEAAQQLHRSAVLDVRERAQLQRHGARPLADLQ